MGWHKANYVAIYHTQYVGSMFPRAEQPLQRSWIARFLAIFQNDLHGLSFDVFDVIKSWRPDKVCVANALVWDVLETICLFFPS